MLLKQQYQQGEVCREAEAFAATCIVFKLKIPELALMSGLERGAIERFRDGASDISTATLFRILKILTPNERNFYNSLMAIQGAAGDAGITMPLLDFTTDVKLDVFRAALDLTIRIFGLNQKDIYTAAGIQSDNFSSWFTGKREINIMSLARIKTALSSEQRRFFEAVSDIYISQPSHELERRSAATQHIIAS